MKTIAVFFGGQSPEHDISVITGIQAFHTFDTSKYLPIPVYMSHKGLFYIGKDIIKTNKYKDINTLLEESEQVQIKNTKNGTFLSIKKVFGFKEIKIDCVFVAFHGGGGEGGSFQGFCETLNLPYTGCDVLGSALCMDKASTKKVLAEAGIPISPYKISLEDEFIKNKENLLKEIETEISYPLFVKPSNGGSSIGISRAKNRNELINALELSFSFDSKVLIEQEFVHDAEINISCLGNWDSEITLSFCEEVYSESDFLDFENKYLKGSKSKKITTPSGSKGMASTSRCIPALIKDDIKIQIETYAKKAFKALNCGGVVRIDFLLNKKNNSIVLIEVNTIPGSFAFYLWEPKGLPFNKLINKMIDLAFEKYENKVKHARKFNSSVFKNL